MIATKADIRFHECLTVPYESAQKYSLIIDISFMK